MQPNDAIRLGHARDAARKALEFTKDAERRDLDTDEKLALALVRLLEIVGEALMGVAAETKARHPEIPWREAAGTRNRLIHGYHDINLDIVWQTITVRLPALVAALDKITPK